MANMLVAKLNGRIVSRYLLNSKTVAHIKAAPNMIYEIIDSDSNKLVKKVIAKTEGKDLILEIDGQVQAVIDNFFDSSFQTSYQAEDYTLNNTDLAQLPPAAPPIEAATGASTGNSLPAVGLASAGLVGVATGQANESFKSDSDTNTDTDTEADEDTTAPEVTITNDAIGTVSTATGDVLFTFTFSESVTGFNASDIVLTGGSAGTFTAVSDTVYTLLVTPDANSTTDMTVNVAANAATDEAGNGNTAAISSVVSVDTVAPTATIQILPATLNLGDTATVTITFSEAVDNFTLADLTAENGTLSALSTADNITWMATYTPNAGINDATNEISLATTYTDTAGNPGTTATSGNYQIDTATADVVFDLTDGESTTIGGAKSFVAGVDYTIYIKVDSNSELLTLTGGQEWTNANNLDAGDRFVLVGDTTAFPIGGRSSIPFPVTRGIASGGGNVIFWITSSSSSATPPQPQALTSAGNFIRRFGNPITNTSTVNLWSGSVLGIGGLLLPTSTLNVLNNLPGSVIDPDP